MKRLFTPLNILLVILLGGLILRMVHPLLYFQYQHDQDLAGWIIKDILVNHHLRLIGQETSSQGVFIGPLFYYLQIPFYLITNMDPAGSIFLPIIIGVFAIFSFYWIFSRVFSRRVGLIAAFIYSFSYYIVFFDREVAPTMPVMLWTVWYLYGLWMILKGKQKAYLLVGFLFGLIWELNLALLILSPLVVLVQVLSKKKIEFKQIFIGLVILVVTLSPFFAFESRHGFSQTKSIIASLTSTKDYSGGSTPGWAKLDRVTQLAYTNTTRLFLGFHYSPHIVRFSFWVLVAMFAFLVVKTKIPKEVAIVMFLWQILYLAFFALNSINISEYYLNGMNVIWIATFACGVSYLFEKKKPIVWGIGVLMVFLGLNLYSFATHRTSRNGYVEKKELISFIKKDAEIHGYPCVAISYITAPGYQFGYRYLFYVAGLKVKDPISKAPVYSIVFPLSGVNHFDLNFGALGLILPEYSNYNKDKVNLSCEGENANLTDPMFGYTQ